MISHLIRVETERARLANKISSSASQQLTSRPTPGLFKQISTVARVSELSTPLRPPLACSRNLRQFGFPISRQVRHGPPQPSGNPRAPHHSPQGMSAVHQLLPLALVVDSRDISSRIVRICGLMRRTWTRTRRKFIWRKRWKGLTQSRVRRPEQRLVLGPAKMCSVIPCRHRSNLFLDRKLANRLAPSGSPSSNWLRQ